MLRVLSISSALWPKPWVQFELHEATSSWDEVVEISLGNTAQGCNESDQLL